MVKSGNEDLKNCVLRIFSLPQVFSFSLTLLPPNFVDVIPGDHQIDVGDGGVDNKL